MANCVGKGGISASIRLKRLGRLYPPDVRS
jgi:hypothetical protein